MANTNISRAYVDDYEYKIPFDEKNPDKYIPSKDYLFKDAQFGIEVEEFLKSSVGKYLKEKLEQQIRDGVDKILNADGSVNTEKTAEQLELLRNEGYRDIRYSKIMMGWIADAVILGNQAYQELKTREEA